jgi:hypothetical protein
VFGVFEGFLLRSKEGKGFAFLCFLVRLWEGGEHQSHRRATPATATEQMGFQMLLQTALEEEEEDDHV